MIGWLTNIEEANDYFLTQRPGTTWESIASDVSTQYCNMAYNRLKYDNRFVIPDQIEENVRRKLIIAQCETAWYLYLHLADEDTRKGLQAQGVISSEIVGEKYNGDIYSIPIPPMAANIIKQLNYIQKHVYIVDRDVDYKKNSDGNYYYG